MGKKKDCGCGNGSKNCISKNSLIRFVEKEMKKLDCGCGCKGAKGFCKKYGIVLHGGNILADCPPGWRNDGITCVEPCKDDEYDDGLTCRKKCEPGWINDGLTCRKPIQSSMNECPPGSKDVWGTCWGPVRQDCIDDCFKHPAPGCRTWECGRLHWAGVDWGPKWCTDCNLRCGQTCWDVQGITKQLHERQLRIWGGEVIAQAIRGKQIRGRVNFTELFKEMEKGTKEFFSDNGPLAKAFDPEKNGVGAAFRKFGSDIEGALKQIGDDLRKGFEKMGEDAKRAFEQLGKDLEKGIGNLLGEEFMNKLKDPYFWVEVVGVLGQIAAAACAVAITVGTLGAGSAAAVGIMMAAQMIGPAAKMIADAATGKPIDALDIVNLGLAAASAALPGVGGMVGTIARGSVQAAQFAVTCTQAAQALGMVPSTCVGNCPPPLPPPGDRTPDPPPPPPPIPPVDPLPTGQLTDKQIKDLGKRINPNIFKAFLHDPPPKHANPNYISEGNWVALFRSKKYGTQYTGPMNNLIDQVDQHIEAVTDVPKGEPIPNIPTPEQLQETHQPTQQEENQPTEDDDEFPEEPEDDFFAGETQTTQPIQPTEEDDDEFPEEPEDDFFAGETQTTQPPESTQPIEEDDDEFPDEPEDDFFSEQTVNTDELAGGRFCGRGIEDMPLIEPIKEGNETINPFGSLRSSLPQRKIPLTHLGNTFNPECYARKNPAIKEATGNDPEKLTTHWIDKGSKEGLDADCAEGAESSVEERLRMMFQAEKNRELYEGMKTNCKATNRFWVEEQKKCDGMRNADGTTNKEAEKCRQNNGFYTTVGNKKYCNNFFNPDGSAKKSHEQCSAYNGFWNGFNCNLLYNIDNTVKDDGDICTSLDYLWNPETKTCDETRDRNGERMSEEDRCLSRNNTWTGNACDASRPLLETGYQRVYVQGDFKNYSDSAKKANEIAEAKRKQDIERDKMFKDAQNLTQDEVDYYNTLSEDPLPLLKTNEARKMQSFNNTFYVAWRDQYGLSNTATFKEYLKQKNLGFPPQTLEEIVKRIEPFNGAFANDYQIGRITKKLPTTASENQDPILMIRTANGFDQVLASKYYEGKLKTGSGKPQKSLTLYYADWCPHCHDMMPEWNKLKSKYKDVKIEKFEQKQTKVKVNGFPTIIFRNGNRMETYEGPRTKVAIVEFLKNKL